MRPRLSSRRFIGRVGELAELELAVREAACGRPTLVLLGGDSGVGKTRIVQELCDRVAAGEDPPLILRGDAPQASDGELPYAALLAALRPLVRDRDPVFEALAGSIRSTLTALLPGLEAAPSPPVPRGESEPAGQARLFEAVLALLEALSERAPLVLILEDVHWADRSTRAILPFLAGGLRDARVALVLTYRTDELHRRHPLRPLLRELERSPRARRVELDPFDRDELAEALTDILGAEPDPALLARLLERGEGNPLYTEELLVAGLDGRGAPPRSLSDAFLGRIETLTADGQRVARALAVGRSLDEPALAALTDLSADALQTALREAVAEQVIVAAGDGSFGFRHALLREALYEDLLPGERGALHSRLAHFLETIAAVGDDERLQRLILIAHHHDAAGDQPAALGASVAAAHAAWSVEAVGEAASLCERALELWPRVPDAEAIASIDHVELLCSAASVLAVVDERERADAMLCEALDELDPVADAERYGSTLAGRARVLWSLNRGEEAVAAGERALEMIGDAGSRERAKVAGWLARVQFLRGRYREASADGEAALLTARAVGDELAETELLNTLGMVRFALGDGERGLQTMRDGIALARRREDLDSLATAVSNLADMLLIAGRAPEALELVRAGLEEVPAAHVRSRHWMSLVQSELALHTGDWALAEQSLPTEPRRLTGILLIFRMTREAELAAAIGDDDRALGSLESVCDLVAQATEPQWIFVYGAVAAEVHARRGELAEAQRDVAEALDRMETCTDDIGRIAAVSVLGMRVEADRAQRARDLGDTAMRRDALARARLHMSRIQAAAQVGGPLEAARLAIGKAEMARARGRGAAAAWARAADAMDALSLPYQAAIAHWRRAESLVDDGDRERASAAAGQALTTATTLGSRWLTREVRGLAVRARLSLPAVAEDADGGTPAADGSEEVEVEDPFGLTDRERQVLSLVAEGATNRQIGAALYMAEKTASVHVSRILAKLRVRSRTEAAAVAHRLGLAAPPGSMARR